MFNRAILVNGSGGCVCVHGLSDSTCTVIPTSLVRRNVSTIGNRYRRHFFHATQHQEHPWHGRPRPTRHTSKKSPPGTSFGFALATTTDRCAAITVVSMIRSTTASARHTIGCFETIHQFNCWYLFHSRAIEFQSTQRETLICPRICVGGCCDGFR